MDSCSQSSGQTIKQHGEAVAARYADLVGERKEIWHQPEWLDLDFLLPLCPPFEVMQAYQLFHDCGKPYCRTVDEDGKQHFPDHARVSAAIWRVHKGDPLIADLIARDMDFHIMKCADLESYDRIDLAPALLLTALCELHANAEMFGGFDSTSFKIKFKALSRLGKRLLSILKESK